MMTSNLHQEIRFDENLNEASNESWVVSSSRSYFSSVSSCVPWQTAVVPWTSVASGASAIALDQQSHLRLMKPCQTLSIQLASSTAKSPQSVSELASVVEWRSWMNIYPAPLRVLQEFALKVQYLQGGWVCRRAVGRWARRQDSAVSKESVEGAEWCWGLGSHQYYISEKKRQNIYISLHQKDFDVEI